MRDVFVERRLPHAVTDTEMRGVAAILSDGCLGIHRVSWCGSLLSQDGSEMFCHFRGLDVESVRVAMRQSGAPPGVAWACDVQDGPGLGDDGLAVGNAVVVHTFAEPATFGARELHEAMATAAVGAHGVRLLRSYLAGDGLKMIGLYRAPDAEALRLAQRQAGLPPDRVVSVRRYAP